MTTTERPPLPLDAQPYVAAVRGLLWALPADERDELLDDLSSHLAELAAEDGAPLRDRLGTPSAYAADFVASAGVEPPPAHRSISMPNVRIPSALVERWEALRPAWLVLRPFVLVFGAAASLNTGHLFGHVGSGQILVLALIALALVGVSQRLTGFWDRAATVAGVIATIVVITSLGQGRQYIYVDSVGRFEPNGVLQRGDGSPVSNIWAYDVDGNPVDVFLFDQNGRPLDDVGTDGYDDRTGDQLQTTLRRDVNGAPIPNLFPREQHHFGRFGTEVDPVPAVSTPRVESSTTTTTATTAPPSTSTTVTTAPAGPPSTP
jgi:hypothetical protein